MAAHLDASAADYREIDYTLPTALVVGAEIEGVSAEGRALADRCICVPMLGMVESLNVSVATAIVLAEARRQREQAGLYTRRRIDADSYRTLLFRWAQPKIARFCDQRGLDSPPLDEDGDIADASTWYARIRSGAGPEEEMS